MFNSTIQKLMMSLCVLFLFASCAHYGHQSGGCAKEKSACMKNCSSKEAKDDDECKDCKK